MNYWNQFLWVIFPYTMIAISVVGHVYRYQTNQIGWSAQSSEFLEKKQLRIASMFFHYGILIVLLGHISGLLLPESFVSSLGVSNEIYHQMAIILGGIGGILTVTGLILLLVRRYGNNRVSVTSRVADKFILILLLLVIGFGIYNTLFYQLSFGGYDYRLTISPWFRSLFIFSPNPLLMVNVPITYKIHIVLAFLTFGVWPFTRLVHIWSFPFTYLRRSHIIFKKG